MQNYNIAILGVGTAGIMSLSHCLNFLGDNWTVTSIYNPDKAILGIGESTSVQIPENLFQSIGFNLLDHQELDATLKLGVKFSNWRKHDFYSHMMVPNYGIHFNNFKLKEYSFKQFKKIYSDRFRELHGHIKNISSTDNYAEVIMNDRSYKFDFIIDCSGWPDDYSEYDISKYISVNSCLVNMIPESGNWHYTHHIATQDGWMFGIPLQTRQGWGYLYNNKITNKEDAITHMSTYFDKDKFNKDNLKEFNFKSYKAKKFIDKRIVKNGNKALFYEPIEALSGYFYDEILKYFFDYLLGKYNLDEINNRITQKANDIELGIAYIYHGGSNYDTPFWKHAKYISNQKLQNDPTWTDTVEQIKRLKEIHPRGDRLEGIGLFSLKSWLDFDKNLKYNIF